MKLGIKKLHENEWQLHVGEAFVRLDRYSLELLQESLDHLLQMDSGQSSSVISGHIKLALKLLSLSDRSLQVLIHDTESEDISKMLMIAKNEALTDKILNNVGGIMSKQLRSDIDNSAMPSEEVAIASIRHIVESMFALEAKGEIEFDAENSRYI